MTDSGGLRERKKGLTRATLIRTGLALIARDGYDAVSTGAIAAAAEVSRATFFNYFSSKEELVLADHPALHRGLMAEAFELRSPGDSPRTVLLAGIRRMLRSGAWAVPPDDDLVAERIRLVATVPAVRATYLGQLADVQREWTDLVAAEFATEIQRTEAAALIGALTGAITNAVFTHVGDGGAPEVIPTVAEQAATTVLAG